MNPEHEQTTAASLQVVSNYINTHQQQSKPRYYRQISPLVEHHDLERPSSQVSRAESSESDPLTVQEGWDIGSGAALNSIVEWSSVMHGYPAGIGYLPLGDWLVMTVA